MGTASAEYLLQLVFYSHHITALHPGHLEQRLDIMGAQLTELDTEHTASCDTARNRDLINLTIDGRLAFLGPSLAPETMAGHLHTRRPDNSLQLQPNGRLLCVTQTLHFP